MIESKTEGDFFSKISFSNTLPKSDGKKSNKCIIQKYSNDVGFYRCGFICNIFSCCSNVIEHKNLS